MKQRKKHVEEGKEFISDSFKNFANKTRDIAKKVIYGRNELPPKVQNILKQFGDAIISGMIIGRTVKNPVTTHFIKAVSKTPYDKLYHLFLILQTNKGNVLLEKNECINMDINPNTNNSQKYHVHNIPQNLLVSQLLQNTEQRMGRNEFLSYSAYDNNCQHFILNVLQANGIHEGADFIKQKTENIFEKNTDLRKAVNTITDIAGRANVLIQGGDVNHVIIGGVKHYL